MTSKDREEAKRHVPNVGMPASVTLKEQAALVIPEVAQSEEKTQKDSAISVKERTQVQSRENEEPDQEYKLIQLSPTKSALRDEMQSKESSRERHTAQNNNDMRSQLHSRNSGTRSAANDHKNQKDIKQNLVKKLPRVTTPLKLKNRQRTTNSAFDHHSLQSQSVRSNGQTNRDQTALNETTDALLDRTRNSMRSHKPAAGLQTQPSDEKGSELSQKLVGQNTIKSETDRMHQALAGAEPSLKTVQHELGEISESKQAQQNISVELPTRLEGETAYEAYLREKESQKNPPERDHTEVLQEQLYKAAEVSIKTYNDANKTKKTKFVVKNKRTVQQDWERVKQNEKLVKSISTIQNRPRQYVDILDRRVDGQNIYFMVGHTRANIFSNNAGLYQAAHLVGKNPAKAEFGSRVLTQTEKNATKLKTIPNSNLAERKRDVLRIHKENLKFVTRLAEMKARQEMLIPLEKQKGQNELCLELKYRSRSATSTIRAPESSIQAQSQGKLAQQFSVLNQSMGKIEEELRSQRAPDRNNMVQYRYLQDTFSSEERHRQGRSPWVNSQGDSDKLIKGIPPQKLHLARSPKSNKKLTAIRQISPVRLNCTQRLPLSSLKDGAQQDEALSDIIERTGSKPPLSKRKKQSTQRIAALNDVMSSPRDNEADHDDRPTTQTDENETNESPEGPPETKESPEGKSGREAARMLNVYIDENPTIDLFIKQFEEKGGVVQQRKKSDDRAKKHHKSSQSQTHKLKRSGSQRVMNKPSVKPQFAQSSSHQKALKQQQTLLATNRTRQNSAKKKKSIDSNLMPLEIDMKQPEKGMGKRSYTVTKIVKMDWSKTGHRFNMKSQNDKRDSSRGLQKQSTDHLMRGGKNADLFEEPSLLPKVKSTTMSNPKFVNKSRLMLGANKFIGGTYRNTSLAQQQINQSKSSAELIGLPRSSVPANVVQSYDASGYVAATSKTKPQIEEKRPSGHRVRKGLFEAGNLPIGEGLAQSKSYNLLTAATSSSQPTKAIPTMPKWNRNSVPVGVNPLEHQQSTMPAQIKDKQQASALKVPQAQDVIGSPGQDSVLTQKFTD